MPKVPKLFYKAPKVQKSIAHLTDSIQAPKQFVPKSKSALSKAFGFLTSKKGLTLVAGGSLITAASVQVDHYISENTGCFLYENGQPRCEIQQVSCCHPHPIVESPFCLLSNMSSKICDGFDEKKENSCCRLCECQHHSCAPNQTMNCRRPTVGEALTHLSESVETNLFGSEMVQLIKCFVFYGNILIVALLIWKFLAR